MKRFAPAGLASSMPITATPARLLRLPRWLPDVAFVLPALILFTVVVIYPVLSSFVYGFTDWNGVSPDVHFIGLRNFTDLFADRNVRIAFVNTLTFTIVAAVFQNGIALGLALALDHLMGWLRGLATALRILFLIPMLLSPLAIGYLGQYIFSPTFGALDTLLADAHLESWTRDWLGDPHLALGSVIAANLWQYVGYNMIIFLAGLQAVPRDLYESASLDGAGEVQQFWHVTWPMIAPATTISLILTLIGGFKVFDLIFAMTNGGPGYATESVVMRVYREGFQLNHFGYAAAISITLCLFIFVLSVALLSILRRREVVV
ncbi:MAG TPA: sugar ABC transporter permease [Ktedonobacterales bacterium]|nr:sugar ABC transporter permease [Ktedonobacterales bacterium]